MPMLEILIARKEPLPVESRRAFAREAVEIFREVLGTQPGRLRLVFFELKPEDTLAVLDEPAAQASAREPRG
jgi:phenylpyruvate tautomerase PptA (4-oxalocrotonate tautomerase family)